MCLGYVRAGARVDTTGLFVYTVFYCQSISFSFSFFKEHFLL